MNFLGRWGQLCCCFFIYLFWLRLALHWSCRAAPHKHDDMIRLNNCIPGPVYPLSTERTVSQSCIAAGHEGGSAQRGCISLGRQSHVLLLTGECGIEQKSCWVCYRCSLYFSSLFQVVRKMMWLMDHVFKYTNFGLVSLIHGDFFIRQVRDPQLAPEVLVGILLRLCEMLQFLFVTPYLAIRS